MQLRIRPIPNTINSRHSFNQPFVSSTSRLSSHKMQVVKSPSAKVLKEELVPPWLQDVRLIPIGSSRGAINFTDFWTQGQRNSAIKKLNLFGCKSKVKSVFRHQEVEEKRKSLFKKINSLKFNIHLKSITPSQIQTDLENLNLDLSQKICPNSLKSSNQLKYSRDFKNRTKDFPFKLSSKIKL